MKLKEDFIVHLGGIFGSVFELRFSVDFSPLFGLRAFGKLLVLLCFFAFEGGFATTFRPVFDRPFAQDGFLSLRYSSSKEWPGLSCLVCLGDGCHLCPVASEINPPDLERSRDCHLRRQNEVR